MNYFAKTGLLMALAVVVITMTGLSCNLFKKKTTDTTTTTTTTPALLAADSTSINQLANANLDQAKTKAKDWKTDTTLYAVNIKLPKDLSVNKAIETFIFGSTIETTNWWTFAISENSAKYVRAIVPKTDYLSTITKAIGMSYWKINYLEALKVADTHGGKTFRDKNADTQITLNLSQAEPKGWLWWIVDYESASGETLKVRVNPTDSTVVDEQGAVIK